jgi:hypothetical protein
MSAERVALFRQRAAEAELKASSAKAEESSRAWLIVARDWTKMAEVEEAKSFVDAAEQSLRQLSQKKSK